MTPRVRADALGELRRLAKGGLGEVSEALSLKLPESPELSLVYRCYDRTDRRPATPTFPLESLARLRLDMPPDQRRALDKQFCWVLRVVVDDLPGAVGILTQHWDQTYMVDYADASGDDRRSPAVGSWLTFSDDYFTARSLVAPTPAQRFTLCRSLALAIGKLHRAGVVYGNLSMAEFLYRLGPSPSVLFTNAESMRLLGAPPAIGTPPHASGWEPPEALATHHSGDRIGWNITNVETDRYKLGLAILRILVAPTSPEGSDSERNPSRAEGLVPGELADLISRCLLDDPHTRPSAKDFYLALDRYV